MSRLEYHHSAHLTSTQHSGPLTKGKLHSMAACVNLSGLCSMGGGGFTFDTTCKSFIFVETRIMWLIASQHSTDYA